MRPHFLGAHRRQHGLGAEKGRFQVDRDSLVELALGEVIDAAHDRDAGVVDENVDRAERRGDLVDHPCDGRGLRYVGRGGDRPAALALDAGDDRVGFGGAFAVVHRDGCAGFGEGGCDRSADAARGACDERNAAIQIRLDGHDQNPPLAINQPPSSAASRSAAAMSSTVLALKNGSSWSTGHSTVASRSARSSGRSF